MQKFKVRNVLPVSLPYSPLSFLYSHHPIPLNLLSAILLFVFFSLCYLHPLTSCRSVTVVAIFNQPLTSTGNFRMADILKWPRRGGGIDSEWLVKHGDCHLTTTTPQYTTTPPDAIHPHASLPHRTTKPIMLRNDKLLFFFFLSCD